MRGYILLDWEDSPVPKAGGVGKESMEVYGVGITPIMIDGNNVEQHTRTTRW